MRKRQRQAADYLNGKTKHWGQRQLLLGFTSFALLFGGSAAYITWQAFRQPLETVRVRPIKLPGPLLQPDTEPAGAEALTEDAIRNIRAFRRHLDSLQQTGTGKRTYDRIARNRPGLLDSLAFVEQVYAEQLKTSEYERKK